jgi:hypothetical protein
VLVIAGVLAVLAGGCAFLGYKGFKALTAPVDAANRWVDAAQAGDLETVDGLSCGLADSAALLRNLGIEHWGDGQWLNESEILDGSAFVSGWISYQGKRRSILVDLRRHDDRGHGGWCVGGAHLDLSLPDGRWLD